MELSVTADVCPTEEELVLAFIQDLGSLPSFRYHQWIETKRVNREHRFVGSPTSMLCTNLPRFLRPTQGETGTLRHEISLDTTWMYKDTLTRAILLYTNGSEHPDQYSPISILYALQCPLGNTSSQPRSFQFTAMC